ncbi:hypothetical protein [Proteiniphilum saccharofermentans]|uniref:hypothetical protein n=1 Tax=Proteiniphilum saccharofermentans TaxID=1642647 RepID=UPI0012B67C5A|nr:hypothetical protein [Proteiniphilum saccharofermentans]
MVNEIVGFREQDGFVYYLHCGNPIYCHKKEDKNSYRHTMASLVINHLCTVGELSHALGVRKLRQCHLGDNPTPVG